MGDPRLITLSDFNQIMPGKQLPEAILRKTGEFWRKSNFNHNIDKSKYDVIYTTSDIHTDVYKLNRLLSSAGLVNSTGDETDKTILKPLKWLRPRTLFVIIGDLVDGSRDRITEIEDPVGDIELLLHIYLFNLRICASGAGSEILFTVGNHDYHSVLKASSADLPLFYDSWVHQNARLFFGSRAIRRICLLPFYFCSPYFLIRVDTELAFIHGGLHVKNGTGVKNMAIEIMDIQSDLDKTGDFDNMSAASTDFLSNLGTVRTEGGPLWTRFYSFGESADVCSNMGVPFKMIVVGHCQTDSCSVGNNMAAILANPAFSDCDRGGCVLLGCDKANIPSLAFVDISMSAAFRSGFPNSPGESSRRAELLKFEHVAGLDTSERYYNKITREKVGGVGVNESLVYWQAKAVGGGSRRTKSKRANKGRSTGKYRSYNLLR